MIRIVPYETRDKEVWNRFNKEAKNGLFMFDRNYMDYHSDRFVDHSLLFYDGHKLLALLPCNVCGDTLYSHQGLTFGGFITQDSMRQSKMLDCFALLRDYMRTLGMRRLIYKSIPYIYHKSPANEDSYALFRNGAKLFRVDCSTTCYKNMRLNELKKRNVKKAEREDVSIEESTDMKGFVELLNAVLQERHGVMAVHTEAELRLLHSRFKENIILYLAKHKEVIVAGSLLFVYENCVHTQYLATNECGRKIGALDLLLKTLIDKYTQSKTYFDFGISTENEGRFLNEGLIFQKESFGGHTIVHNFYELLAGELPASNSLRGGGRFSESLESTSTDFIFTIHILFFIDFGLHFLACVNLSRLNPFFLNRAHLADSWNLANAARRFAW